MSLEKLPWENKSQIEVLNGKLNIILTLMAGQFVGFLALVLTILNQL